MNSFLHGKFCEAGGVNVVIARRLCDEAISSYQEQLGVALYLHRPIGKVAFYCNFSFFSLERKEAKVQGCTALS
jgi:hypothetical protein